MSTGRVAGALVAAALAVGAAVTAGAGGSVPQPAFVATVAGEPGVTAADLAAGAAAVDVGAVPAQFDAARVRAKVLSELVAAQVDDALARSLGATVDLAKLDALEAGGLSTYGSAQAFQQAVLRDPTAHGLGWAGTDVYLRDQLLRQAIAVALAKQPTPVPAAELMALFAAHRVEFEHAHLQVLSTPDAALAARVAAQAEADPSSFPMLVRAYTDDAAHRASGGDYGPALARGQLYARVEDAVYAAGPGAIVGPVTVDQTPPESYVVRVLDLVEHPYASVLGELTAYALVPTGTYVLGLVAARRTAAAADATVDPAEGSWDPETLTVRAPAS